MLFQMLEWVWVALVNGSMECLLRLFSVPWCGQNGLVAAQWHTEETLFGAVTLQTGGRGHSDSLADQVRDATDQTVRLH